MKQPLEFFYNNLWTELNRHDESGMIIGTVTCIEENAMSLYNSQEAATTEYGAVYTYSID